jgi:hypothetical protein
MDQCELDRDWKTYAACILLFVFYSYIWIVYHTTCGSLDPEVFPKLLRARVYSRHRLRMLVPACQGDAEWKCKKSNRINSTNNRLGNQHADKRTCKTNFWKHCLICEVLACGCTPNISYNDCGDAAMALGSLCMLFVCNKHIIFLRPMWLT